MNYESIMIIWIKIFNYFYNYLKFYFYNKNRLKFFKLVILMVKFLDRSLNCWELYFNWVILNCLSTGILKFFLLI